MVAVEVLDRVTHRFGRPAQAAGDAPADLGQRGGAAPAQAAGTPQNLFLLLFRQLRKSAASATRSLFVARKGPTSDGKKADLAAAVAQDRQADQAALAPAVDRLGRDVQLLADLFQRQHRLRTSSTGIAGSDAGQLGDQQRPGRAPDPRPSITQVRVSVRAIIGDAVTDELVRVLLVAADLGQQPLGPAQVAPSGVAGAQSAPVDPPTASVLGVCKSSCSWGSLLCSRLLHHMSVTTAYLAPSGLIFLLDAAGLIQVLPIRDECPAWGFRKIPRGAVNSPRYRGPSFMWLFVASRRPSVELQRVEPLVSTNWT